ncbi:DUF1992 domain-containing protein [Streptomyces sp. NBC_01476]|uniref:DnaJ family domain-containing protein n=1 Tax=Streptomyces sp. NBC_01476 TaxID=2903881 RepID=UPI002E371C83|nr:DUF1992 domain-containing protein [Streptomyces sp. NBC_01476]
MTERKPPGVSFESWTDKQIREAEARGAFAGLTGAGKPLASLNTPYDELWWLKGKMQREGLSVLPPTLALRKEAEDTLEAVAEARSEQQVRRLLGDLNAKIEAAIRRPPQGPPLNLAPFDIERLVGEWRESRPAPAQEPPPESESEPVAAKRRRWWGRRAV